MTVIMSAINCGFLLVLLFLTTSVAEDVIVDNDCSKQITFNDTDDQIIYSPGYPDTYPANLNCVWVLVFNDTTDVFVMFEEFSIGQDDNLALYSGDENGTQVAAYKGNVDFALVYSSNKTTRITFNSGEVTAKTGNRFKLHFKKKVCSFVVAKGQGKIATPVFLKMNGTMNCTYNLIADNPTKSISLSFPVFNISKGSVIISDGDKTLANLTGNVTSAGDVISSGSGLKVFYLLPTTRDQPGFVGIMEQIDSECSGMLTIDAAQSIKPTGGLDCRWLIHSPDGTTIQSMFTAFNLLSTDRVILNDGDSQRSPNIDVLSKDSQHIVLVRHYVTSGNSVWIQFRRGFELSNSSNINITLIPQTYGRRLVTSGNFSLKDTNPDLVPSGGVIVYQMEAPQNQQVYLTFGKDAFLCANTTIQCYDGFSIDSDNLIGDFQVNSNLTAKLSNGSNVDFHPVFSNGNQLTVLVHDFFDDSNATNTTNVTHTLSGVFKSVPNDGSLYNSMGGLGSYSLQTEGSTYPDSATWLIHNLELGDQVALKIAGVLLGDNNTLTIYDGLEDSASKIVQLKESAMNLPTIYVPRARVSYQTVNKSRFDEAEIKDIQDGQWTILQATYSVIPNCYDEPAGTRGSITTPDYPNQYPYNAACTWNITIPAQKMIHLSFANFDLAQSHSLSIQARTYHTYNITNHTHTNVTTRDLGVFGGKSIPNDVVSGGDELLFKFSSKGGQNQTSGAMVSSGFNLSYETADCGGNLTTVNGSLSSPGYPKVITTATTCVWIISVPTATKDKGAVNIVSFKYEISGFHNNTSLLEVRDGARSTADVVPLKMGNVTSDEVQARYNTLYVSYTFQKTNAAGAGFSFKLNYTTYECPKSEQCNNSVCMHKDWKCNGVDNCGDGSDEANCSFTGKKGYAGWVLGVAIICTVIIVVFLTLVLQAAYKRWRYSNYRELRDLSPVPT